MLGHGHSHGNGQQCSGEHGPGGHSHGGLENLTEEQRKQMMQIVRARMEMMRQMHAQQVEGGISLPGQIYQYPEAEELRRASGFLRGYGHEPPLPPVGWGELAVLPPPLPKIPQPMMFDQGSMTGPGATLDVESTMKSFAPSRDNYWQFLTPWGGRLRVVKDRGGFISASIILLYWLSGNWSTWNIILIPRYAEGGISVAILLLYAAVSVLCITSFFRASTLNPGSLHTIHTPEADWTECQMCLHLRPPQSHHCRRCGQCVRKMDHHCPWINNCVGEENKFAFMQLLAYAFLLSLYTLLLQILHFFVWDALCTTCIQETFTLRNHFVILIISAIQAIFMLLGAGSLYITQHISVICDMPTLEWMKIQQELFLSGKFPNSMPPQTKSTCEAYTELCGTSFFLLWPFPCRRRLQGTALSTRQI